MRLCVQGSENQEKNLNDKAKKVNLQIFSKKKTTTTTTTTTTPLTAGILM